MNQAIRREPEAGGRAGEGEDLLITSDNVFGTPEQDAFRRDFTVNALFYDIANFSVIDWVGGLEDLKARVIRTIGDPIVRLREDPVRMLRAVAIAARLDFTIDPDTAQAVRVLRGEIVRLTTLMKDLLDFGRLAEMAGAPIYIVHMTAAEAVEHRDTPAG